MRKCGLWISAWVPRDQQRILDTAAADAGVQWAALHERDPMPDDTVLVVVHPATYQDLRLAQSPSYTLNADSNGRALAAWLIGGRCAHDEDLRRRLRWGAEWL